MYIASIKIDSYKIFNAPDKVNLTSGFNLVVGKNNSGKTAFLETASLKFKNTPHRSIKNSPQKASTNPLKPSKVVVNFKITGQELNDIHPPVGDKQDPIPPPVRRFFKTSENVEHTLICHSTAEKSPSSYLECSPPLKYELHPTVIGNIAGRVLQKIYSFKAERMTLGESPHGNSSILKPDASNLAEVLLNLQSNSYRFQQFNDYVHAILPDIHWVSAKPTRKDPDIIEILVWPLEPKYDRQDLTIPLSQSGSGVGQVLAILYVVLNSTSSIILIDEPQSFLHPGATRTLIEVLKQSPQHQFIFSSHSPSVISAVSSATIIKTSIKDYQGNLQSVPIQDSYKMGNILTDLGVRLSDVFGYDSILWVEGETEEKCFPLIIEKLIMKEHLKESLCNLAILHVMHTGDFSKKSSKLAFNIYERLSKGEALLPPAIGFIFDCENKTEKEREDLRRMGKGRIYFLPRHMFENYLLNPEAIAILMSQIKNFSDSLVTEEMVSTWIDQHNWDREFLKKPFPTEEQKAEPNFWIKHIRGDKLLKQMFSEFSETRVEYDKVKGAIALTTWLIENKPTDEGLNELKTLLLNVLKTENNR